MSCGVAMMGVESASSPIAMGTVLNPRSRSGGKWQQRLTLLTSEGDNRESKHRQHCHNLWTGEG